MGLSHTTRGAGINMTPLIDVVLVLLVVVLITAQVASRTKQSMAATLPKAASGQDLVAPHVVSLLADGHLFYDKQPLELAGLRAALEASNAAHGRVVLDVEAQVAHQRVIELLDELAAAGVTDAAFATERKR